MQPQEYYPPISSLVDVGKLPSQLGFLKDTLTSLFDTTFFRDLQHTRSEGGGRAFYSLTLLRYDYIGFKLPGTDIEVRFNASGTPPITQIPMTLQYDWRILDLIGGFSIDTFLSDIAGLYNVLVRQMGPDPITILRQAIDSNLQPAGGTINSFVAAANNIPGVSVTVPTTGDLEAKIREVIGSIEDQLGVPAFEIIFILYLASAQTPEEMLRRFEQLFSMLLGGRSVREYLEDLLIPRVDASLSVNPSVVFPRSILTPVNENYEPIAGESTLSFGTVDFYFSTTRGIGFDTKTALTLSRSMIGNTGLIIEFQDLKLDLSTTTNIPEAAADGRGPEFVGAYVREATIVLPKFWKKKEGNQAKIVARNVLIGTGGISGSFSLEPVNGKSVLETYFGARDPSPLEPGHAGFGLALNRFDISFHQGAIKHSNIQGTLTIPSLGTGSNPLDIDVQITIDEHGFRVGAVIDENDPALKIGIQDIFEFEFRGIAVGSQDGRWFLEIGGTLNVTAQVPVVGRFIKEPVEIQKLIIWSNGEFDFQGGSFVLPKITPLKLGPVELSITAVHFGRDEQGGRKYKFIGFDGGVKTGSGAVDARGEGIKFYFTVDNQPFHSFLRIETIRIDLRIPGDATPESAALLLKGYVSMKNPPDNSAGNTGEHSRLTEYAGGITFSMPKLKFGGGAEMRMIPSIGAFFVDANIELATPILLGSTGLGIYGFRGLFGKKYVIQKPENETWWEFYKKPKRGINADKFTPMEGFSVGAGASIGTAGDSGTTFSSKLFFLITVPTAFFLEGQAAILSQRVGLDTTSDPPFYAVLMVKPDEGIMAGFGANFKVPQATGDVLTLDASIEMAFFFGRASAWRINIGQDEPVEKRIRATILKIFDGWAYFMLASSGIKMGAGIEWKFEQDCGIAKVGLGASLEYGGRLNFRPVQVGGWVILQGYAELRVFGIGFRLSVRASLAAEAPKPFIISGSFELSLSTPWPLPDVDISVNLSWHFNDEFDQSEIGMIERPSTALIGQDPYSSQMKLPVRATHMLTGESFPVNVICTDPALWTNPGSINESGGLNLDENVAFQPPPATNSANWLFPFDKFVIPIDAYLDFEFNKPVQPREKYSSMKQIAPLQSGAVYSELVPPQKGVSNQVKHVYTVDDLSIFYLPEGGGTWKRLNFAEANTPLIEMIAQELGGDPEDYVTAKTELAENLRIGFWQITEADRYTKLRLLSRTPLNLSGGTSASELGFPPTLLRCPPPPRAMTCQDWLAAPLGTYPTGMTTTDRRLRFKIYDDDPENGPEVKVVAEPVAPHNYAKALRFQSDQQVEILFPGHVSKVKLLLSTLSERVVISYYSGYASSGGGSGELSNTGRPVDQWNVSRTSGGTAPVQDDMWDRLRALPSITRAFCSGAAPSESLPPVSALKTIMSKKFYKTNLFLRQNWGMPAPVANAAFCPRLREMLAVVIVSHTGKDRTPRLLKQNIDNFYRDAKRNAERYMAHLVQSGGTIPQPPAAQNAFYEKWLDLIACIGKTYEIRGSFDEAVKGILKQIDMEIGRLYSRVQQQISFEDLKLNPPANATDPMARLKVIAAYITVHSLTLDTNSIPQSLIDLFDNYFERLDPIVARLRSALAVRKLTACAATSAAAIPGGNATPGMPVRSSTSCGRLKSLYAIVRLLTAPSAPLLNSATTPIITAITSLINGFDATVDEVEELLGWTPTSYTNNLANDLARAVRTVAIAWSVIDEMPGSIRTSVNDFFARLEALAAAYEAEVEDLDPPQPNELLDEFATDWIDGLICLCNLCAEVEGLPDAPERDYFTNTVDPKIDALYNDVLGQSWTGGESMLGTPIPDDDCTLTQWAIWLMTTLTTKSGAVTAGMQNWLATELAAFQAAYGDPPQQTTRFIQGPVMPYTGVICAGGGTDPSCTWWVDLLDCLDQLIKRRAYLPQSIIEEMEEFDQVLMDLYGGFMITYNDNSPWPYTDTVIENVAFSVDMMLGHIYDDCLQGNPVNPLLMPSLDLLKVAELQTRYNDLLASLAALPANEQVDCCVTPRTERSKRQLNLIQTYRRLCNAPPTLAQLAVNPLAAVVQKLQSNQYQTLFNDVTSALDLEPIPTNWQLADFCTIVGQVVRTLVIAYGSWEKISPALEARMNAVEIDFNAAAALWNGSPAPLAGVQTTCDTFLSMLLCIAKICRYRDFLPTTVFTGNINALRERLGARLEGIAEKSLQWSEELELETVPNRSMASRCRKVRTIINYFGANIGNYTKINAIKTMFDNRADLLTALRSETQLVNARGRFCPEPGDGPYDPLRKRLRVNAGQLGSEVVYGELGDEPPIDRIVIAPVGACQGSLPCASYLLKVCWLTEEEADYNDTLPSGELIRDVNNDIIYSLNKVTQPLWRPNTRYAIRMVTTEWIGDVEHSTGYRRTHYFGFRTAGPIGHFHEEGPANAPTFIHPRYEKLVEEKKEETFQYTGLKQYIDYQRSYPNADGNIIGAKPLYYEGSKFLLFYARDYMNSMFGEWDQVNNGELRKVQSGLKFIVRDPGFAPDAAAIEIPPVWKKDIVPPVPPDVEVFDYIMQNAGDDCLEFEPIPRLTNTPPARSTEIPFKMTLIPSKLYTAIIHSVLKIGTDNPIERQVHKFVFQTSRYRTFAEHIGSYILKGGSPAKKAKYEIDVDPADAAMALAILKDLRPAAGPEADRYDLLGTQYGDKFERIVDGALRLGSMERPATTEFAVLTTANGATVLGVLARSPEPFNDPKQSVEELEQGISVSVAGNVLAGKKLFAKDATRILLTKDDLTFPTGTADITFTYRLFNGEEYAVARMVQRTTADPNVWEEVDVPSVTATIVIT